VRLRRTRLPFAARVGASLVLAALSAHASAVDCNHVLLEAKSSIVCRVDVRKESLRLFLNDPAGQPLHTFKAVDDMIGASRQKLAFAMNAGMFHPDYAPVGLFIDGGKEVAPLNTAAGSGNFFLKPNGVFLVDDHGPRIVDTSQFAGFRGKVTLATQSGPLLVHAGNIHAALGPKSTSRLIRNGVGVDASGAAVFAISEDPVNFHEFARLFKEKLGCQDALYFDGVVSSVYVPALQLSVQRAQLGPIIAVVE